MKSFRFNGQKSAWAALLLSGLLLAGCGQEDDADGTGVPEEDTNQEQSAQGQQESAVDEEDQAQDDQFVSEDESVSADAEMNGEPSNTATAPEEEPLSGEANEDPGFGDGTDPMPSDGEDAETADDQEEASQEEEDTEESEERSE